MKLLYISIIYNMSCEKLDGIRFRGTMHKTELNFNCGEIERYEIPVEFSISYVGNLVLKVDETNLSNGRCRTSLYNFDGMRERINGLSFKLSSSSVDNGNEIIEIPLSEPVLTYKLSQRNCDISLINSRAELVPENWYE